MIQSKRRERDGKRERERESRAPSSDSNSQNPRVGTGKPYFLSVEQSQLGTVEFVGIQCLHSEPYVQRRDIPKGKFTNHGKGFKVKSSQFI